MSNGPECNPKKFQLKNNNNSREFQTVFASMDLSLVNETDTIVWHKNENPGFHFLLTPKKVLTKISHPNKVITKFQTKKRSSNRKFKTQKRASHISITYIQLYPHFWDYPWGNLHLIHTVQKCQPLEIWYQEIFDFGLRMSPPHPLIFFIDHFLYFDPVSLTNWKSLKERT